MNAGRTTAITSSDDALEYLLLGAAGAAGHELPRLIRETTAMLGALDACLYLVDMAQMRLVPFVGDPLIIDASLAGRAYQLGIVTHQSGDDGTQQLWLPLVAGAERVGVLAVDLPAGTDVDQDSVLRSRLSAMARLAAHIVVSKSTYSDTIVALRRRAEMSIAAELQWSLLPPLAATTPAVQVAGVLEPAYEVAGDCLDYSVDAGQVTAALFDGMGHGTRSSELAGVAVTAYRNSRRAGAGLIATTNAMHDTLSEVSKGTAFTTAVLLNLDTDTGLLSWVNAGHPPPLLLRDGRLVKTLERVPTPPLGMRLPPDVHRRPPELFEERLEPDDLVVLYTDGVTEAHAPDGELFGEQRFADLLIGNLRAGLALPETLRRVVRSLLEHQQDQLSDDATVLMLRWGQP